MDKDKDKDLFLLAKKICGEMGIRWDDDAEYATINGVEVREYMKTHDILDFGANDISLDDCKQVDIGVYSDIKCVDNMVTKGEYFVTGIVKPEFNKALREKLESMTYDEQKEFLVDSMIDTQSSKFSSLLEYQSLDIAIKAMSYCYHNECTIDSLVRACKSGHWSLLEHVNVSIEIECSQKVLAQISRHRHFSYTVQSTRGMDTSVNGVYNDWVKPDDISSSDWDLFIDDVKDSQYQAEYNMEYYKDIGIPLEYIAYLLPLGSKVKLVMTGNLRAWMEYLKQRVCKRASYEHQQLAKEIYRKLNSIYPSIVNIDMLSICENCKELSCDFTSHKKAAKSPVRSEL